MNKAQTAARAANIAVLARNYPEADAAKLQDQLYALALKCERNAQNLCNIQDHPDQRDALCAQLQKIAKKHGIILKADVTGDPRGACLKLFLPDQSHNTWGGIESGYAIVSI